MNGEIRHILKRLPEKKPKIESLLAKDPEFVALCEDYDDCVNALGYWNQSNAPEAETRANEYRILIQELEEEIIDIVKRRPLRSIDISDALGVSLTRVEELIKALTIKGFLLSREYTGEKYYLCKKEIN